MTDTAVTEDPITDDDLADALAADVVGPDPAAQSEEASSDEHPGAAEDVQLGTYVPNIQALAASHGNPDVWAHELFQLIGNTTGNWISEDTLRSWMVEMRRQVTEQAFRAALFQVANTSLPATVNGDPAMLMLQLRDDIAAGFRFQAGLAR